MSLNGIMNTAIGALQVNQTALKTVSNNISNINTEGYNRRIVQQSPGLTGGNVQGVAIAEIRRITDSFLTREAYVSSAQASASSAEYQLRDRAASILGKLDGGASLTNRMSDIAASLGQLAVEPASSARRVTTVSDIQASLNAISSMASQIQGLRQDANTQLEEDIRRANNLLTQIADLNTAAKTAIAQGDPSTGLLDQREKALSDLSELMDIQTFEQPDGRMFVSLTDGTQLVGDMKTQLNYQSPGAVTSTTSFPAIQLQRVNHNTGENVGQPVPLEGRLQGGSMRGVIDMRDKVLPDLAEQLGAAAGALTDGLNAIHNDATSFPAPNSLTGTNTGVLGTDTLNFSGQTTLAVTNYEGRLVRSVAINFDAGTLSVNGGAATPFSSTAAGFVADLNAALGGDATFTLNNGVLSAQAAPQGGLSFRELETNPSDRGGRSFSHFFGLNDLVRGSAPANVATGLTAVGPHGFTSGGTMNFTLRAPAGQILQQGSYTVSGSSMNDLIAGLNTAANGAATFSLAADGSIAMSSASGARLEINNDTTSRGATGLSVSRMFGLGTANLTDRAVGLSIRADIRDNPSKLAAGKLEIGATPSLSTVVIGQGDNRAAQEMAGVFDEKRDWPASGGIGGGKMSISQYVSQLTAGMAQGAQAAEDTKTYREGIAAEVKSRKASAEGVNLDEELAQMIVYQQAYNAAARIMTTVQDMYDTLVSLKR
jgi:flagellar hook-associated protein 1 FlgK